MITLTDLTGRHYLPEPPSEGCRGVRSEVVAAITALPGQVSGTDTVDVSPT